MTCVGCCHAQTPDGKPQNSFGYDDECLNKDFTLGVIRCAVVCCAANCMLFGLDPVESNDMAAEVQHAQLPLQHADGWRDHVGFAETQGHPRFLQQAEVGEAGEHGGAQPQVSGTAALALD